MSYESPIEMIYGQMRIETENAICKAVQNVGVNVDKDELIKALQYDREQYQKGYKDRDEEIVRCKDCAKRPCIYVIANESTDNWYCASGIRKDEHS